MALPVLNHGPLGELPENIPEYVRNIAYALKNDMVTPDGRVDYTLLLDAEAYTLFQQQTRILRVFSPDDLPTREARLAFWINVYNLLAVHGIVALGIRQSVREVRGFFCRVAYEVGGYRFSLDDIQHGILRGNRWKHPLALRPFRRGDPRRRFAMEECDPRIHCALVSGTRSSPPFDVYEAQNVDKQLDEATRRFINATTHVDPQTRTVTTSILFRRYRRDFGQSEMDVLRLLLLLLDDARTQMFLRQNLLVVNVVYTPYDWSLNSASHLA